jgi:hypothetical protein
MGNLREALREWRELGGRVEAVKGTDEVCLVSELLPAPRVRVKVTRKDTARCVTVEIRRLRRALEASGA